jgi:hypothetical protein
LPATPPSSAPPSVQTSRPAGPPTRPEQEADPAPAAVPLPPCPDCWTCALPLSSTLDDGPGGHLVILRFATFLEQIHDLIGAVTAGELEGDDVIDLLICLATFSNSF